MTFVFFCLVLEMVLLTLLLMPLPFKVRKGVVMISDKLIESTHYRVFIWFIGFIVSLMFLDSLKRSTTSYHHHRSGRHHHIDSASYLSPAELANRNYNQRNMYITGLVLYFALCIPTIVSILKKLIKHKDKYDNAINIPKTDDLELNLLKEKLESKKLDIETMKKQIKNLSEAYNKLADESKPTVASDRKND